MKIDRRAVILLHWLSFLLVYLIWSTTPDWPPWLVQPFVAITAVWVGLLVVRRRVFFKPGPKLDGGARLAHRLQHPVLYLSLVGMALVFLTNQPERVTYIVVQVIFFGGLMHGLFHLWRHTALYDGSLRNITPRFLHKVL
ncbi:MAG: hypothetical protein AAF718_07860 [Pseudomonadota bacterium]